MDIDTRFDKIETRLDKHDEKFVDVLTRLAHIESNMATKEDMAKLEATMIKWMVGLIFGASVAAITVMTFVLNNAVPKTPVQPPTPIVIQVPAYK
ncbi:hypothetical protein GJ699_30250 [Duganella sp. FT80W]|uniref:Uncharacterized protein n=1 Tax=Duganella guangzhouensis TaxID=2666084 RepID=A0A6I2L7Q4_9BURK|nr:hypothetical protein [Duganella guangzhouensis]MRW94265.1 hypothetical protein [Duganella guangzhouensis]